VIAAPPFQAGADQARRANESPAVDFTAVGGSGTVRGVTLPECADAAPVPAALAAATVNVYAVPFASPPTVQLVAPVVVQVAPPGAAVAV
jgi:hypothetical protein